VRTSQGNSSVWLSLQEKKTIITCTFLAWELVCWGAFETLRSLILTLKVCLLGCGYGPCDWLSLFLFSNQSGPWTPHHDKQPPRKGKGIMCRAIAGCSCERRVSLMSRREHLKHGWIATNLSGCPFTNKEGSVVPFVEVVSFFSLSVRPTEGRTGNS